MAEITKYRLVLYGASADKPTLKGKIELYGAQAGLVTSLGRIRFHEGSLPPDVDKKGDWTMNLPSELLVDVLELLRHHPKVYFAFHEGRAVLGTGVEPVGTRDEAIPIPVKITAGAPVGEAADGAPSADQQR